MNAAGTFVPGFCAGFCAALCRFVPTFVSLRSAYGLIGQICRTRNLLEYPLFMRFMGNSSTVEHRTLTSSIPISKPLYNNIF